VATPRASAAQAGQPAPRAACGSGTGMARRYAAPVRAHGTTQRNPLPITWRGAAGAQRVRLRRWGSAPVAARPAAGAHAEDCNADSYSSR